MEVKYCIHDDLLLDDDGVTSEYCAHIFIAKKNAMFLESEDRILPQGDNLPEVRSGTITFIEHEGSAYGITCGHVLDALKSRNRVNEKEMSEYCEGPLPDVAKNHFFVSKGNMQYHVRGHFHKVEADFGVPQTDIALAKLPYDFISSIGRKCLKIGGWPDDAVFSDPYLTGLACGCPEMNRTSRESDIQGVFTLGKGFVVLRAKFDTFTKDRIRILDTVNESPGVNVLSGMSGGPLFWCTRESWGLAGIVKRGGDMHPNIQTQSEAKIAPTINVEATPAPEEKLKQWIEQLPDEDFPDNMSSSIFIPKGFKGFK